VVLPHRDGRGRERPIMLTPNEEETSHSNRPKTAAQMLINLCCFFFGFSMGKSWIQVFVRGAYMAKSV